MQQFSSIKSLLTHGPIYDPVVFARPSMAFEAARQFSHRFQGRVFYAIKANPNRWLLNAVFDAGIRNFDIASESEMELISSIDPDAQIAFLHPVKSPRAIARAYFEFGCRIFALDCKEELRKIIQYTEWADDLQLIVRCQTDGKDSLLPLVRKFGVLRSDMPKLIRETRWYANKLGVSFHVGSQCMNPERYRFAMQEVSTAIVEAGVTVDIVDVGGGFPQTYQNLNPPPLAAYTNVIHSAFAKMKVLRNAELWAEPGRFIAAESSSLLTRVNLVRGTDVFLNDGGYGALYDAVHENWTYPITVYSASGRMKRFDTAIPYTIYGPSCDASDCFPSSLGLPANIREGDYIEFNNIGAYGETMASRFNGFGKYETVLLNWRKQFGEEQEGIYRSHVRS